MEVFLATALLLGMISNVQLDAKHFGLGDGTYCVACPVVVVAGSAVSYSNFLVVGKSDGDGERDDADDRECELHRSDMWCIV